MSNFFQKLFHMSFLETDIFLLKNSSCSARRPRNVPKKTCEKVFGKKNGFTLVELLVSIAITAVLVIVITTFAKDVFYMSTTLSSSMDAQIDARHILKGMVTELREASPSSIGSYPIALASTSALTFYSDVNNDGLEDQVRYFVSGTSLQMGVTSPSGSPLSYNSANEKITTLVSNIVSSSTQPIFQYYPSTYAGTSTALTQPVDVSVVRLVKITISIDKDPHHSPTPIVVTSQATLRNLKDNY